MAQRGAGQCSPALDAWSGSLAQEKVYSVTEITREVKGLIEEAYAEVWVEGQVSGYRGVHSSGHRYFSLKDAGAVLKAALFKNSSRGLAFELEEGMQVLAYGRLSLYEPRGEYQLMVSRIEAKGVGALQIAFEQLKKRLQGEGLFERERKRTLPPMPRHVALITSPTGAVLQDFLNVTARRCPWVDITVLPVKVQGEGSADEVVAALGYAGRFLKGKADLVVLARGGGSLEDLWSFNEEKVARAIAACGLPVISAIGHETDTTIADMVADLRAPTPSAAAELVSPSKDELLALLSSTRGRLASAMQSLLENGQAGVQALMHRLGRTHPRFILEQAGQRLDELSERLGTAFKRVLRDKREAVSALAAQLNALSPLAILGRGYAAAFVEPGSKLLRSAAQVKAGDELRILLGKGEVFARVEGGIKGGGNGR